MAKSSAKHEDQSFGKFASFGEFIESYRRSQQQTRQASLARLTPAEAIAAIRQRDVVEVSATIKVKEPDDNDPNGGKHHRFIIRVVKILKS
ncbi:MAG: hypothetical protein ACKV0T_07155, partial [Planctomycetales bacterium]